MNLLTSRQNLRTSPLHRHLLLHRRGSETIRKQSLPQSSPNRFSSSRNKFKRPEKLLRISQMKENWEKINIAFQTNSSMVKSSANLVKITKKYCLNKLYFTSFKMSLANFPTSPESTCLTAVRSTRQKNTKLNLTKKSISAIIRNHSTDHCTKSCQWMSLN